MLHAGSSSQSKGIDGEERFYIYTSILDQVLVFERCLSDMTPSSVEMVRVLSSAGKSSSRVRDQELAHAETGVDLKALDPAPSAFRDQDTVNADEKAAEGIVDALLASAGGSDSKDDEDEPDESEQSDDGHVNDPSQRQSAADKLREIEREC